MFDDKGDQVVNSLASAVVLRPQFEVLYAIVVAHAILVMNRLNLRKVAPEVLLHYQAMLWNIPLGIRKWVIPGAFMKVFSNHDDTASPAWIVWTRMGTIGAAIENVKTFAATKFIFISHFIAREPMKYFSARCAGMFFLTATPTSRIYADKIIFDIRNSARMATVFCVVPRRHFMAHAAFGF